MQEIAQVEAEIDRIETQTIERLAVPPDNQVQQIELLGKLMLYDKQLSVNRNEGVCNSVTCPRRALPSRIGAEPDHRLLSWVGAHAIQQSQAQFARLYAACAYVHYNPGQGDLVGGNFWDMRATGRRLRGQPSR